MVGKEKASLSRASMGRAWQPVGDASWDVEAEARRRRARRMRTIGSWACTNAAHSDESDHRFRRKVITSRSEATRELDYESR